MIGNPFPCLPRRNSVMPGAEAEQNAGGVTAERPKLSGRMGKWSCPSARERKEVKRIYTAVRRSI